MRLHAGVANARLCNTTHSDCPAEFWLLTVHCLRDIRSLSVGSGLSRGSHRASRVYALPRPATGPAPWASSNILPVAYAMMESRLRTEAKYQGGRSRGGLCRGPGSG